MKKINLLISAIVLSSSVSIVYAADEQKLATSVKQCAQELDNFARLNCFDRLASQLKVSAKQAPKKHIQPAKPEEIIAPVSKPKPVVKSEASATKPIRNEDNFAKAHLEKTAEEKAEEVTEITATVTKVTKLMRGQLKIALDNGQVWQQKDSGKLRLEEGQEILLETGALNAIYLKKVDENKRIRVRRVK
ncbi:hypothetical protein [Litorilituus lipolyticus]|uniref:Type IV pilus biogenesis protein PilP n=1 Tax=Litorilituus lipolyticus TaxID=2491017 RepID=A0A502KVR3_9GAMM|nr:hypothetical protein [Litorilituus lipolyticus]TPH15692.1 hypothetical protein EPA86_08960 [Litorilituus lipolyticus]